MIKIPETVYRHIDEYAAKAEKYSKKLAALYRNCYPNTLQTALIPGADGSLFVLTGDIPAMWLRDSTAQVSHYIREAAKDSELADIIKAVIKRQLRYIPYDPYANAFNETSNGKGHIKDVPKPDPLVWERKYEIDSLCYPIRLLYLYVKYTQDRSVLDGDFRYAAAAILKLWRTEQHHTEKSTYKFYRECAGPKDTVNHVEAYTGMTWSGFRPSDDACRYGYLIPSNLFAAHELSELSELLGDDPMSAECLSLRAEILEGVQKFGTVEHPKYGRIYACETDGLGHCSLLDDANVPSLLSLPYLGCVSADDEIYANTRRFILSHDNPYYYEGKYAKGIGSPHTPEGYIWHIALAMQGLTSNDPAEVKSLIDMLINTDADTGFMHEGFCADDPTKFTRSHFCWANSLFAEFVEYALDKGFIG